MTTVSGSAVVGTQSYPASASLTLPPPVPAALPPVDVGYTTALLCYPKGTTYDQAYAQIEAETGTKPLSMKVYFLGANAYPVKMSAELLTAQKRSMVPVLCYDSMKSDGSDEAQLTASLKFFAGEFKDAVVVFVQEPNNPHHTWAGNVGVEYVGLAQKYYPAAKAAAPGWPVAFCPSMGGPMSRVQAFYPGPKGCDGIGIDCYAHSGTQVAALNWADQTCTADGLKAGVGFFEMGVSASPGIPSQQQMATYLDDTAAFFQARRGKKPCLPVMWWNGPLTATSKTNCLVPATWNPANNYIVPLWTHFYSTLTT